MNSLAENQLYEQMIEHIKKAGEAARRMAIVRADRRWHTVGENLMNTEKLLNALYTKRRGKLQ